MEISVSMTGFSGSSEGTTAPRDADEGETAPGASAEIIFLSSDTVNGALSAVGEETGLALGVLTAAPIVGDTDRIVCFGTIRNFLSPMIVMLWGKGAFTGSTGFFEGEVVEFN